MEQQTGTTSGQAQLGQFGEEASEAKASPSQTLVFATPGRAWQLVKQFAHNSDSATIAEQAHWDLLAADEASMLTLPMFILAGSALKADGQILVGGDHRQLPPVQKHDWKRESRRDIRSTVPYVSALNYLRLLRGEQVFDNDDRQDDWHHDHDVDVAWDGIPFIRLSETYRFGETTADLVEDAVYAADDNDYDASPPTTTPAFTRDAKIPEPVAVALDTAPITLVTYDDPTHQQSNPVESAIATNLLAHANPELSAGVVTPHNAQRSSVSAQLDEMTERGVTLPSTVVETVNRFQGGQQDLMIVSATVSDPQYIFKESEFLLNENRINVSFTRHQHKLIVLAPESLLGYIAADADIYNETLLWKLLASRSGESPTATTESCVWTGEIDSLLQTHPSCGYTPSLDRDGAAKVNIYRTERR